MRIGIIGLGLIGSALGFSLGQRGHETSGFDIEPRAESDALQSGCAGRIDSLAALARRSDVVILCIPPRETVDAIPDLSASMKPGAVLTDVASVKRPVINAMNRLSDGRPCVGGHPLAGRATHRGEGISPSYVDLFRRKPYAIVPADTTDEETLGIVRGLVTEVGANVFEIDAADHDRIVARTSHLPQIVSTALSVYLQGGVNEDLKGTGLAGMLRLAKSDEALWSQILTYNADNVGPAIQGLVEVLQHLIDLMARSDGAGLHAMVREGREYVVSQQEMEWIPNLCFGE